MTDSISERVLNFFSLNGPQRTAAQVRGRDVAVTAGAGSGKTRTLVARYTCLLAEGVEPRRIAAVTFTDKACAESPKVRESLSELERQAQIQKTPKMGKRFPRKLIQRTSVPNAACALGCAQPSGGSWWIRVLKYSMKGQSATL